MEHSGTERGRKGKREDLVAGMETKSHNPARATEAKCPSDEWADSSLPRVRGGGVCGKRGFSASTRGDVPSKTATQKSKPSTPGSQVSDNRVHQETVLVE